MNVDFICAPKVTIYPSVNPNLPSAQIQLFIYVTFFSRVSVIFSWKLKLRIQETVFQWWTLTQLSWVTKFTKENASFKFTTRHKTVAYLGFRIYRIKMISSLWFLNAWEWISQVMHEIFNLTQNLLCIKTSEVFKFKKKLH